MYREYYKKIGDLWKDIVEAKKPLDPVGQEDKDIDNDGDHDKSDKYLHNRRKAVKGAIMKKEEVELDEANIPSEAEIRKLMAPTKNADQAYVAVAKKFNVDPATARRYVQMVLKADMKKHVGLDGKMVRKEALDLDTKAVDKALTHDCAKHVTSEKWGHGECLPGQHTIVEGEDGVAYVTHYDVMFEHGIEFDVPVEELDIVMSESHKHTAKKMAKEETNKVSVSKDYAKHYKNGTKPEKYGDTNSEGEKKFAAMHDFGKVKLVYDDEAGHTDATKAGKITKKSSHPGNLNVGHKNFGD